MKKLKSASIDLTYHCNFRCLHCFNSSGEHKKHLEEMSDDEVLKVAIDIASMHPDSICLCGGETMLRKELIFKVCNVIKNSQYKNVQINTVSNGFLIDKDIARKLKEVGLSMIQISLDGATAEVHDWLRNKEGSFEKAVNAIRLLVAAGLTVAVAFTPTKKNVVQLEETIDFAYGLGVKFFRLQPTMNLGRARKHLKNYFLSYTDYMDMKFVINKKIQEYIATDFSLEWGDPLDHLQYGLKKDNLMYIVSVGAYGDIQLTPYLPFVFGNIRKHSVCEYIDGGLKEAWKNPVMKEMISRIRSVEDMDVSLYGLPEIYLDDNIYLDILDYDYEKKTQQVLQKYLKKNVKMEVEQL